MTHSDFVHLHLHTQYSLLDGACILERLIQKVKDYRMPACAITDHGNMFGAIEFYDIAMRHGVKPIIGCEVYIAPDSRFEKSSHGIQEASFHLILLAKNEAGYKNLVRLVSLGFLEGFYYRPRIDKEILVKYKDGLICTSSCLKGEIPHLIQTNQLDQARKVIDEYKNIFGKDNFYLEIQDNLIPEQDKVNEEIIKLSKEMDLDLVATNDVHYLEKEHAKAHEMLLCIQTQTTMEDPNRMRFQTDEFYFKSREEMMRTFQNIAPEAVKNTMAICEKCNIEFDFKTVHLPNYKCPEGVTREAYLRELVEKGLRTRYSDPDKAILDRAEHELKIIEKSGYINYFLIAWDFVHYAKSNSIPVGPGRGSAAGSVVSYALGITDIDPLKYDLLFERFLNPERISLPDIDIDFCYERRSEVIDYVVKKYSKDNVAQIITFGTMLAKAVIRDVGRAMGMAYGDVDRIAKLVPNDLNITLSHALEQEPELANLYKQDSKIAQLIDTSLTLEGLTRHASTHAAGVVISEKPLIDYIPLYKIQEGQVTTGYPMTSLEKIGLLKMDFLGLRTLTVISETRKIIKRTKGADVDIDNVPLDDKKTFKLLANAESMGVFQLESSGMRDLLKKLKPARFEDIIALLALFRPGPIGSGMLDDFMRRKHGEIAIRYDHKLLEPILKETYGVIVYQEQVMRIASSLAGFSLAEADNLRRAMAKKTPEVMAEVRQHFVEGCSRNDIDRRTADKIFNQIEYFAGYGFNKCVVGSTEVIDADTGEVVSVERLYNEKHLIGTFSCDEKTLRVIPQKIKNIVCNGVKKVFRVRTQTGKEIIVTDNHPFLTISGWGELRDLSVGDMIATPRKIPQITGERIEDYKVATLAHLLAEGNFCHTSGLYFYNSDKSEVDDFVKNVEYFDTTKTRVYQRRGQYEVYVGTGLDARFAKGQIPWNGLHYLKPERCGARKWIEELGLDGKSSYEKFIPRIIYTLPLDQLSLFIGRLWSGDGFIFGRGNTNEIPFYATSSRRMAKDVCSLLLRLGIMSVTKTKSFKYTYKNKTSMKTGYAVYLFGRESTENFLNKICPHIIGRDTQISDLRNYLSSVPRNMESKDVIPLAVKYLLRAEKEKTKKTWRQIEAKSGLCVKELSGGLKSYKKGFRRSTVKGFAHYFESTELLKYATSDILWDTITSIEYAGEENTYDIEMDEIPNFIADGIIVHNSHSTAYAMISYRTAYLKANYSVEFMAALLTSEKDNLDKIASYINEAIRMGIKILPPDINESLANFTVVGDSIRFGLVAVKNVGQGAIESIIKARQDSGRFKSIYDFTERVDPRLVNRKVIESLVKCGALDSLGLFRSQASSMIDRALEVADDIHKDKLNGQLSFFDKFEDEENFKKTFQDIPNIPEWPEHQLLAYEKEMLGFYITKHPLARFEKLLSTYSTCKTIDLQTRRDGDEVLIGGIISKAKFTTTRKTNEKMAIVTLEDLYSTVEVLVFPQTFAKSAGLVKHDAIVFVKGRLNMREEEPKIVANEIASLDSVRMKYTKAISIELIMAGLEKNLLDTLKKILSRYPGRVPVYLKFKKPGGEDLTLSTGKTFSVEPHEGLVRDIEKIFGRDVVTFRV